MSIVELALHDGRKVGIPAGSALILYDLTVTPDSSKPKAQCLVRYVLGDTSRVAHVRGTFKQVLSLFPMSCAGPWWHSSSTTGGDLSVPANSVVAYEETESRDGFRATLAIPTGPIELDFAATMAEIKRQVRQDIEAPRPRRASPARKKAAAKKPPPAKREAKKKT